MTSNIDNPMDRLAGLSERIRTKLEALGLSTQHIAFSPSVGPGGQHMVQLVLRLEPASLMDAQSDDDVSLTEDEAAAFAALMGGASQVDSSDVDRDKEVKEINRWIQDL